MRTRGRTTRYGLLVDIGSGSVGVAIVVSEPGTKQSAIIYEKREYVRITQIESLHDSHKALISTLTDVLLTVPSEGLTALYEHTGSKRSGISHVQVTVSAPWVYTVSRTINYEESKPFTLTDELVHDLAVTAGDEAMRAFSETAPDQTEQVAETSRSVQTIFASGYRLPMINRQEVTELQLTHTTTLVYKPLHAALVEVVGNILPKADLQITSSMLAQFHVARQLYPAIYDFCLIDVTSEATEIGIVRDGTLSYCTHTSFGTAALIRELSNSSNRPIGELQTRLGDILLSDDLSEKTVILEAYLEKVSALLKETGDTLAIPRTVFVVADQSVAAGLTAPFKRLADKASKSHTTLQLLATNSEKIASGSNDYTLAASAGFFHTGDSREHFEFL